VKNTIDKLKSKGAYYEEMILMQEKDYDNELNQLEFNLIDKNHTF